MINGLGQNLMELERSRNPKKTEMVCLLFKDPLEASMGQEVHGL